MVDELQLLTGMTIRPMIAPLSVVEKTIEMLFRATRTKFLGNIESFSEEEEEEAEAGGGPERRDPGDRRAAAAGTRRPHRPHGEPDPRAGAAGRRERHSRRAVRGFLRHSPAGGRRAAGALSAADVAVRAHRFPLQDSGEDGHRRETHPARRRDRVEVRRQARRPPRQHGAHRLRREGGDANSRQRRDPHRVHRPGLRRAAVEGLDRVHSNAARLDARHRADRQRQEHHPLRLSQPAERAGHEHLHGRGPGGVQVQGHQPGAGENPGGVDIRRRPAGLFAAGPGRDHGGRGPRPGDGADLPPRRASPATSCSPRSIPTIRSRR